MSVLFIRVQFFMEECGKLAENNAISEVFRYDVAKKAKSFYTYDGLVASTNMVFMQWEFMW